MERTKKTASFYLSDKSIEFLKAEADKDGRSTSVYLDRHLKYLMQLQASAQHPQDRQIQ